MEIDIGATVRVISENGEYCRKGCVAYKNNDGTCDIIYQKGQSEDEESSVDPSRISVLFSFENEIFAGNPLEAKVHGNKLFQLKDYDTAYEYYIKAQKLMQAPTVSVGKHVIIRIDVSSNSSTDGDKAPSCIFEGAVVSDLRANDCVDVIYDNCVLAGGGDEEENVARNRVFNVFTEKCPQWEGMESETDNLDLQRGVLMNLSKCALKRGLKGWAVRWALLATALIRCEFDNFDDAKRNKYLGDALVVSCRSLLQACRPHMAKQIADQLIELEDSDSSLTPRGKGLLKEIESFCKQRQKDNRVLARNIAEWVDVAMSGTGGEEGKQSAPPTGTATGVEGSANFEAVDGPESVAIPSQNCEDNKESPTSDENCLIS